METRLQSNEVRIPKKPDFDLNSSSNSKSSDACNYFKSSFARSLSFTSNQTKSLDFGINFKFMSIDENDFGDEGGGGETLSMPPFPVEQQQQEEMTGDPINATERKMPHEEVEADEGRENGATNHEETIGKPVDNVQTESLSLSSSTTTLKSVKDDVWTAQVCPPPSSVIMNHHDDDNSCLRTASNLATSLQSPRAINSGRAKLTRAAILANRSSMCDSSEIEVLRLRKECQNLIEENRRLLNLATGNNGINGSVPASNVEAVILQSQVDTLQWQLKQVESSRQMYRAVMEEVVRFLERCHLSLDAMLVVEPISRSKSTHHVHQESDTQSSNLSNGSENAYDLGVDPSPSPPPLKGGLNNRARCSTIETPPKLFARHLSTTIQSAGSYTNFRDFTWRRNKNPCPAVASNMELEPEKLSQEAFRLLRTANNLLNTQEPMLVQTKSIFDTSSAFASPNPSPHPHHPQQQLLRDEGRNFGTFSRKSNARDSCTSSRSSCDTNSTASTSSSTSSSSIKPETDEELHKSPSNGVRSRGDHRLLHNHLHQIQSEAESGFSSISSFQEIGLPLINPSARLLSSNSSNASDDSTTDCQDVTVKAETANKIGLPAIPARLPYNHRRWDSAPALPPKKASLSSFNATSAEETLRVLWV